MFLCAIGFLANKDLRKHVETVHEGKKPHSCSICDTKFASKHNLNSHVRKVHDKIKPFVCHYCSHCFSENYHIKTNVANVHKGKKSNDMVKEFLIKTSLKSQIG